jgi:hypothetical protein
VVGSGQHTFGWSGDGVVEKAKPSRKWNSSGPLASLQEIVERTHVETVHQLLSPRYAACTLNAKIHL